MKQGKSIVLPLAVSIIAISFSAIFVKLTSAPSSISSMYRLWLASLFLLPVVWLKRGQFRSIARRDWLMLAGFGFFWHCISCFGFYLLRLQQWQALPLF